MVANARPIRAAAELSCSLLWAEALPELGSAALGGFLEPPPLQPLDHTSISQMRKDLEAAHQKQLHAKGDHSP